MKNQNKFALYIFIAFVTLCIVYAFVRNSDLKMNGIVVEGKVLKDVFATKSSVMQFEYEFFYQGKLYRSDSPAGVTNASEFVGKIFPVRFSPKTGRSEILVTPRHFMRYDIPYPDSLGWVKKYVIAIH